MRSENTSANKLVLDICTKVMNYNRLSYFTVNIILLKNSLEVRFYDKVKENYEVEEVSMKDIRRLESLSTLLSNMIERCIVESCNA